MKRVLPWILLPYLTLSQADTSDPTSLANMLNQVSDEASQTTLESKPPEVITDDEPTTVQASDIDVDQLTQSIAGRLSEILETDTTTNPQQLSLSLESVVSDALHDGKQMDEIRHAVTQAMKEVTGQDLQLNPDVLKIEKEMARQPIQPTPSPKTIQTPTPTLPTSTVAAKSGDDVENTSAVGTTTSDTVKTTTVLPGESLSRVAQRIYGKDNDRRFLDIYELNKDVIEDINIIREGMVLKLP